MSRGRSSALPSPPLTRGFGSEIQLSQWRTQVPPLAASLVFCSCYCRSATTVAESAIYGPLEHDGCAKKRKTQGREYGLGAALNGAEQVPCSLQMRYHDTVTQMRISVIEAWMSAARMGDEALRRRQLQYNSHAVVLNTYLHADNWRLYRQTSS
ncbi:hypothetical protein CH063_15276 [Colletotrichum higginsianum]|uniref:Uncharacterized protein n=1 Tax=Colletotrichum higginsianum (strain IMI 349063) TaxID=759273 RepID=H1W252_COLHI|nr:hypothetical protein CH063_15276 [Colletotrichum higginsianum]